MPRKVLVTVKQADRGRRHRGDIMSPATRSKVMARIKGKDTGPERILGNALKRLGLNWLSHSADLPGRPDFVFKRSRLVLFVDGDFWHGWRFPVWRDKLTAKWDRKINANRQRDIRVRRSLRRIGWTVLRIWEHQIKRDLDSCVRRVSGLIEASKDSRAWSISFEPGISRSNGNKNPRPVRRLRRK